MKLYSVVIPVFNECESLRQLLAELEAVAAENGYDHEIIFVDDGSTDGSWEIIESLAAEHPHVRGICLRRNFGKAAALSAGFTAARGDFVFTMDADLQDNPAEIPNFLQRMTTEPIDVLSGWKKIRHDPFHKTIPSRVFNWMVSRLTGVKLHDHNCGFKCYRREVLAEVDLYGEMHRFIPVLAHARGFRVDELVVDHRRREFGVSKYGFNRFFKGFLDLLTVHFLTGYRQRPQHLLGMIALFSFLLGLFGLGYLAVYWCVRILGEHTDWDPVHQRPLLIYSLGALLLGVQLLSIGFLAELITSNYRKNPTPYSVRKTVGEHDPDD